MIMHGQIVDALLSLIGTCDNKTSFFEGLLTPSEILEIIQRLNIALCIANKHTYVYISELLDVSSTTVARVAHTMKTNESYRKSILSFYEIILQKKIDFPLRVQ